jgi:hypothetical protein
VIVIHNFQKKKEGKVITPVHIKIRMIDIDESGAKMHSSAFDSEEISPMF